MAEITGNPRLIKNLHLDIDGDTYQALVTDVHATSPAPVEIIGGTDDAVFADVPAGGRKLNISGIQDWETENSLCNYLLENEGEIADVVFSPRAGGAYFACQVVLYAPTIGGQRNTHGTFQLALPIVGGGVTPTTAPTPPSEPE
jgi:hypothetical protein